MMKKFIQGSKLYTWLSLVSLIRHLQYLIMYLTFVCVYMCVCMCVHVCVCVYVLYWGWAKLKFDK